MEIKIDKLGVGERFLIDWQYRLGGSFTMALAEVCSRADMENLARLKMGFPDEVSAFTRYIIEKDYWKEVQKKHIRKD